MAAALGLTAAVALTGCVDHSPAPAATSPVARAAPTPSTPAPAGTTGTGAGIGSPLVPAATALPGMPVPTATGPSPVDSSRIASLGSLPAAFHCPSAPSPITIPAVEPAGAAGAAGAAGTAAPPTPTPAAVVCPSPLAGGEALYLWYAPTPELKLAALTAALRQTKYVHGGPNWVAGGTVNPAMGTVGGEVYR